MTPKWKDGELLFLKDRQSSKGEYHSIFGADSKIAEEVLSALAESFDIPEKQAFLIKPADKIQELYHAVVVGGGHDDLEIERLKMWLKDYLHLPHFDKKAFELFGTVEDLIREVLMVRRLSQH
jgi:hypothetical protein